MHARAVGAAVVLVVAATAAIRGQAPSVASGQPSFRAGTTLVEVSAIVTLDGRPVTDLRVDELTVLDNGEPQPVVAFERIDLGRGDQPAERRDFVLVLDDLHVAAARTKLAIDAALQFVDRLGPHDRLAVVNTGPYDEPLQLTTEREPARRLIRRFRGQGATAIGLELETRGRTAMQVLRDVAANLRSDAGERRAVLLISEGHPAFVQEAPSTLTPVARGAFEEYMGVLREAAMSNVAIYTVDPRGLVAPGSAQVASRDVQAEIQQSTPAISTNEIFGSLAILARNTGGVQTLWTNDLTKVFPQILQDSRQYYRIAYVQPEPRPGKRQPPSRKIAVKVSRPGVDVRARQEYAPVAAS